MQFLKTANFDWMEMLNFYERPFRAKLVPAKIWEDLDRYKNKPTSFANYFKKWRTRIEWMDQKSKAKVYDQYVAVGGEYDPNERQCIIQIYTKRFSAFQFTEDTWEKFKYKVIQTLQHEMIHFMQYDRRQDECSGYVLPYKKVKHSKKNEERKYLSEFDEIQAYAHCTLLDFKCYKPSFTTDTLISRSRRYRDSRTLYYFLKAFDFDYRNNHAIPKLMQQIAKWERKYERIVRASKRPK